MQKTSSFVLGGNPLGLDGLRQTWPALFDCVDPARTHLGSAGDLHAEDTPLADDFGDRDTGGRGDWYRAAQVNPTVRIVGIRQVFARAHPSEDLSQLSPQFRIADLLGGDGTLTRALRTVLPDASMPTILTSDLAPGMVAGAMRYGLPAIQQAAQALVLKDRCMNAVIIAYGSHHIPAHQRLEAAREAFRVLKPGGRLVLHDFENDSPMARWFEDVVDKHSETGHQYDHFTRAELQSYLDDAGFSPADVRHVYDPFIVSGSSPDESRLRLGEHLVSMYGLVRLAGERSRAEGSAEVYELASQCFRYDFAAMGIDESIGAAEVTTYQSQGRWYTEMPRVALVATGTRGS